MPLRGAYRHAGKEVANNPRVIPHGSNFFERPLFRQLVAETLGPFLFPAVIEEAVGFKTNNASAMPIRHPLSFPLDG
ncbi:MAG: hypothetical protein BA869_11420 [Desulfuromonadales bacterium C00003107]|nr:MAG: hypothetical protein BA869_11420 [Desulfuromonadales bacterium C00003107]